MITAKEVRKQLKPFFGWSLRPNIILTDTEYNELDPADLRSAVIDVMSQGDCDDYTRELWCHLRHLHPQCPIGICLLSKVADIKKNHAMVVAATTDGIYLVEPQAVWDIGLVGMTKMWRAHSAEDRFYFIYI
jgi:hypothetical protein